MVGLRASDEDHRARALRARVLSAMAVARPHPGELGPTGVLNRLCRTIVRDLAVTGAAVNLMAGPSHAQAVVGMSDDESAVVDDLQFTAGEGPCHDALRTGRPVHSSDLGTETRWPGYCSAAREHDVLSVYAFPLQVGAASLGVLDVYDSRVRVLDEGDLGLALAYADIATESLLHGGADTTFIDPGLRTALGSRAQIYQAQGMVRVDNDISLNEAMVRIRAFAYGNGRAIADVAHDIVEGSLLLPASASRP
jgi:GAF domain/ANTAR domain